MKVKLIIAVLCIGFLQGCESDELNRIQANEIRKQITYIKDDRTGNCFACYEDSYHGGLATVPCESIPDYLLVKGEND